VARLTAYKVGETKLSEFMADAGMTAPEDGVTQGWHVVQRETTGDAAEATSKFRVEFRLPAGEAGKNRGGNLADLEFKAGLLTAFKWNN
jgi:hypothetical protein